MKVSRTSSHNGSKDVPLGVQEQGDHLGVPVDRGAAEGVLGVDLQDDLCHS